MAGFQNAFRVSSTALIFGTSWVLNKSVLPKAASTEKNGSAQRPLHQNTRTRGAGRGTPGTPGFAIENYSEKRSSDAERARRCPEVAIIKPQAGIDKNLLHAVSLRGFDLSGKVFGHLRHRVSFKIENRQPRATFFPCT